MAKKQTTKEKKLDWNNTYDRLEKKLGRKPTSDEIMKVLVKKKATGGKLGR